MGNPRKPTHLKVLQGTVRKCRQNTDEPIASSDLPIAPGYLSASQAEKFNALLAILDGMGVASADNVDAIAILAVVLVDLEDDTVLLQSVGAYYVPCAKRGIVKAHPAVGRMAANRQRAQALLGEFGLTPAARSRVGAKNASEANPFAALGGKQK